MKIIRKNPAIKKIGIIISIIINYKLGFTQNVTYDDIRPLINKYCINCHKTNGIAPISFDTYKDIRKSSYIIKKVIENNYMPPWKPDPSYSHFIGERIVSEEEKSKIIAWINNNCPINKHSSKKADVTATASPSKQNRITFKLPFNIHIPASLKDTNVFVEMEYELERDTFISSIEFISDKNNAVHHAMFYIHDLSLPLINKNKLYYEGDFFNGVKTNHRVFNPDALSLTGGWTPGTTPFTLPEGMGYYLPKKGIITYQVHYGPSPVAFNNSFQLKLTYAEKPMERIVIAKKFGSQGGIVEPYPPLLVPPDTIMHFTMEATFPDSFSLIAVSPHMHLLGKKFTAWIVKPNGDTLRLIRINDWDFNWQGYYYLPNLVKIEKGSVFYADVILDNTQNNIRNPNHPPKYVKDGNDTKDEMIQLSMLLVPYMKGDEELHIIP